VLVLANNASQRNLHRGIRRQLIQVLRLSRDGGGRIGLDNHEQWLPSITMT
jgi:hypothetical protein